ncbi:hypothetical protein ScPMuIL_009386 [Solemya velum]
MAVSSKSTKEKSIDRRKCFPCDPAVTPTRSRTQKMEENPPVPEQTSIPFEKQGDNYATSIPFEKQGDNYVTSIPFEKQGDNYVTSIPFEKQGDNYATSIPFEKQGDNYACSLCDKTFNYKNGIIRHVRLTHAKEKPYKCNICHRSFGYKNILMEHQNIHFGIKPYACNMCDKRFAARSNLVQHKMIHRKPFSCSICNKRFDKSDQLQRHMLGHPGGFLSCNLCSFVTSNQVALNDHVNLTHFPQRMDTRDKLSSISTGCTMTFNKSVNNNVQISESDTMRKIDNICAQLATKTTDTFLMDIKQEPESNSFPVFPVSHRRPGRPPGSQNKVVFSSQPSLSMVCTSPVSSVSAMPSGILGSYPENSPQQVEESPFSVSSRQTSKVQQETTSADSTSSLSEMLAILQNVAQRSHDLGPANFPQISLTINPARSTRDVSTQFTAENPSIPQLSDVLSYYESLGKIHRCHHCNIIFEERGLYFLHISLHGPTNPWECGICHKICADRNDFHLHFVNQQHDKS